MIRRAKMRAADKAIKDRLESACNTIYDHRIDVDAALADFQQRSGGAPARLARHPKTQRSRWAALSPSAAFVLVALGVGLTFMPNSHHPPSVTAARATEPDASAPQSAAPGSADLPSATAHRVSDPPAGTSRALAPPSAGKSASRPIHAGHSTGVSNGEPSSGASQSTNIDDAEANSGDSPCSLLSTERIAAGFTATLATPHCDGNDSLRAEDAGLSASSRQGGTPAASAPAAQPSATPTPSPSVRATPAP